MREASSFVEVYSEVLGTRVRIPEEPRRIVSLSPALTEALFMLGLSDRVVGVSYFCNKPAEAKLRERVGSYFNVDWNKLKMLEPDLILLTTGAQRRILRELVDAGFTVYPIPLPVTIYGLLDQVLQVGAVTGKIDRARKLAETLFERLLKLRGAVQGIKVFYEINLGGPVTFGAYSYITDAFRFIGASTPFDGLRTTWIARIDYSAVARFDPDVIVYETAYGEKASVDDLARRYMERGLQMRAIMEKKIIVLPPDTLAHYGPSFIESLERLVGLILSLTS
ncbi:MAG: ABC transporter substrate-binding protein [Thermoproteota archaeon]